MFTRIEASVVVKSQPQKLIGRAPPQTCFTTLLLIVLLLTLFCDIVVMVVLIVVVIIVLRPSCHTMVITITNRATAKLSHGELPQTSPGVARILSLLPACSILPTELGEARLNGLHNAFGIFPSGVYIRGRTGRWTLGLSPASFRP